MHFFLYPVGVAKPVVVKGVVLVPMVFFFRGTEFPSEVVVGGEAPSALFKERAGDTEVQPVVVGADDAAVGRGYTGGGSETDAEVLVESSIGGGSRSKS